MADLICIGNAMIDVFAGAGISFCRRFGLEKPVQHIDPITAGAILKALPGVSPKIRLPWAPEYQAPVQCAGGGAANTAKIAARLGTASLFAGAAGRDALGDLFEKEISGEGAALHLVRKDSPTGVFISIETGGERRIAASPAAALELEASDIPESLFAPGNGASPKARRILLVEGFLLDFAQQRPDRPSLWEHITNCAEKYGLTLAVDPGTAENAGKYAGKLAGLARRLPLVLLMNEEEAAAFSAAAGRSPADCFSALSAESGPPLKAESGHPLKAEAGVRASAKSGVLVAVKLGPRGAEVYRGGQCRTVPAEAVKAVESTGAGDAFAAGFLGAVLRGLGPEACARAGNAAAAMVLAAPGTVIP